MAEIKQSPMNPQIGYKCINKMIAKPKSNIIHKELSYKIVGILFEVAMNWIIGIKKNIMKEQ